jgi:sporulation protein YlmC with PRC-barrel domain
VTKLPRGLETKSVFDWDNNQLGTVLGSELDPKTRDPTSLIIDLSSDGREQLDTERDTVSLPFDYVFGIRRDEVRLSRGVTELLEALEPVHETEPGAEPDEADTGSVELKA